MKMGMLTSCGHPATGTGPRACIVLFLLLGLSLFAISGCSDDNESGPTPPEYQQPKGDVWLFDMWSDSTNIWVVGYPGVLLHYDGADWELDQFEETYLVSIWGESADDLYAAGEKGTVLHYDGSSWTAMDTGYEAVLEEDEDEIPNFFDIGRGPFDEIFAVGSLGACLRLDGAQWVDTDNDVFWYSQKDTVQRDKEISQLTRINKYGIGGSNAFVLMEDFPDSNHYWRKGPIEDETNSLITASLSGSELGDNYFANENGRLYRLAYDEIEDMLTWAEQPAPASLPARISDVSRTPDGANLFFSTTWGLVSQMTPDGSLNEIIFEDRDQYLSGVLALAADDVYVCGKGGLLKHYDGTEWTDIVVPLPDMTLHQTDKSSPYGDKLP